MGRHVFEMEDAQSYGTSGLGALRAAGGGRALPSSQIRRAQSYNQRQGLPGSAAFVQAVRSFQAIYNVSINPPVKWPWTARTGVIHALP